MKRPKAPLGKFRSDTIYRCPKCHAKSFKPNMRRDKLECNECNYTDKQVMIC